MDEIVANLQGVTETCDQTIQPDVRHLPGNNVQNQPGQNQADKVGGSPALRQPVGIIPVPSPEHDQNQRQPTAAQAACGNLADLEVVQGPEDQEAVHQHGHENRQAPVSQVQ
jgi:hypothetical protein